jgi:hypothetical protein
VPEAWSTLDPGEFACDVHDSIAYEADQVCSKVCSKVCTVLATAEPVCRNVENSLNPRAARPMWRGLRRVALSRWC